MILANEPADMRSVVGDGMRVYARCFKGILPWALMLSVVGVMTTWQMQGIPIGADQPLGLSLLSFLLSIAVSLLISIYCLEEVLDRHSSDREKIILTLRLIPVLIVMYVLFGLAVTFGLLLFLIPGLILLVTLMPASTLYILQRRGPVQTLRDSHTLVWGSFWRAANIYSMFTLLVLVPLILVAVLASVIPLQNVTPLERASLFSAAVSPWISSVFACLNLALVNDLLLRKQNQTLADIAV